MYAEKESQYVCSRYNGGLEASSARHSEGMIENRNKTLYTVKKTGGGGTLENPQR